MRRIGWTLVLAAVCLVAAPDRARAEGFALERYVPPAAGSWFFLVDHPWYSSTRWFAGGVTLDYGSNPLYAGQNANTDTLEPFVRSALVGHVDLAGSFLDRVQVRVSLPLVLQYWINTAVKEQLPSLGDVGGMAVGNPRVGLLVRAWGQPDRGPISIHVGLDAHVPIGTGNSLATEGFRLSGQLVLAGVLVGRIRWAASGAILLRPFGVALPVGSPDVISHEIQLRGGLGWTDARRRFSVGPEATLYSPFTTVKGMGLEALVGGQWNIARQVQVGVAAGGGLLTTIGTPQWRVLFRVAYAPQRVARDGDGDGVVDDDDRCPTAPGRSSASGCPDEDEDGVADSEDLCPKVVGKARAKGCPDGDSDGVPDSEDLCPKVAGKTRAKGCPDMDEDGVADAQDLCPKAGGSVRAKGCPDGDSDGVPDGEDLCPKAGGGIKARGCPDADEDGVADAEDLCPKAAGSKPTRGCPDSDGDGVPDAGDACLKVDAGKFPDPARPGCPLPDGDGDGVPDTFDACPRLSGVQSDAKAQNGCPRIAEAGWQSELKMVHFDTNDAKLLPSSFPVLDELAGQLKEHREAHLLVEGHADDTGTPEWNQQLSRRRADAVVAYLVKKGVRPARLRAQGYGDTRPLTPDRSDEGRAKNRRVEIRTAERK